MQAVVIVIDSFGIGALPDADRYGDEGANTALSICNGVEQVKWPWLKSAGLGNAANVLGFDLPGCEAVDLPIASFGVMAEKSPGKDTTTGHWELAGIELDHPFRTFDQSYPSFPEDFLSELTKLTGHEILGNKGASGTAIIEELGADHMAGKGIIVYTSADSVVQIAAHEAIVPIEELYKICEIARKLCDPLKVGRVIARPFEGEIGNFKRTSRRRDFSILPPENTILTHLSKSGVKTVAVGKIGDIFCEHGIDVSFHDAGNVACIERLKKCLQDEEAPDRFIFVNLVDSDMLYGHRRDIQGYHDCVMNIDKQLPSIVDMLSDDDLLIITADHGCDPGFKGTDHTREYVPVLSFRKSVGGENLGIRGQFSDVAQSLASFFNKQKFEKGISFL